MRSTLTVSLLLTCGVLAAGFEFSEKNCNTWTPTGMTAARLTTKPPYKFSVSDDYYQPGKTINVEVSSEEDGPAFQNVFLQTACAINCTSSMYGVWSEAQTPSTVVDCTSVEKVAIFAITNVDRRSYNARWTAQDDVPNLLTIMATLVQNDSTWWSEIIVADLTKGTRPSVSEVVESRRFTCSSSAEVPVLLSGQWHLYGFFQLIYLLFGIMI